MSVTVVIASRGRPGSLERTVARLASLPERPAVVVVDNGSPEGPPSALARDYPQTSVLALPENRGAAARTHGAQAARTPYVAFCDDDSWWEPGSLARAATLLERHPRLALVAGRVLVGEEQRLDPTCGAMRRSPLAAAPGLPGPPVLGFVACGAVVRRAAFLAVGGFERRYGIGGEEELLAYDLVSAGYQLVYCDELIAHHHPSPLRNPTRRRAVQLRNALWSAWLRRPLPTALRRTAGLVRPVVRDAAALRGAGEALAGLPWVLQSRRSLAPDVEAAARLLGL